MVLLFLLLARALYILLVFLCRLFIMYLSFTCSFSLLSKLLIMVVVSFLIMTFVLFRIVAPRLFSTVFGSLSGCIFLQLPLHASRIPLLMSLLLLSLSLPALLSGIIV
jgi:hypothetical protein